MTVTCVTGCLIALPAGYALLGGAGPAGEPRGAATTSAERSPTGDASPRPAAADETLETPAASPGNPLPAESAGTHGPSPSREGGHDPTAEEPAEDGRDTSDAPSPPDTEPEPPSSPPPDDDGDSEDWCPFEDEEWRRKYCDV